MPYNPGVQDISGQLRANGNLALATGVADGLQGGFQAYQQNKFLTGQSTSQFEAALAANPEMAQVLTDPSGNAPTDAAKAFSKLQKQGAVGLQDAAVLSQFASAYGQQKQQQQDMAMKQQQLKQQQYLLQEAQQKKAEEDSMNAKLQQMSALGQQVNSGVGLGVMRPDAARAAQVFLTSPAGQLASLGMKITPEVMAKMQELKIGADSREEVQNIRSQTAAQVAQANADKFAAQAEAKQATQANKDSATAFNETKQLRDEFGAHPNTKSFDTVDEYYNRGVQMAANNADPTKKPTIANDMGLIFSLMKVFNPEATVREGEYATASNSGSIPDWISNKYNKLIKDKGILTPDERSEFVDTMKTAAIVQNRKMQNTANQYVTIAKKRGLDPSQVVAPNYLQWSPDGGAPAAAPQAAAPQTTAPIMQNGGRWDGNQFTPADVLQREATAPMTADQLAAKWLRK